MDSRPYFKPLFPHMVCKDGAKLSVQCNKMSYCHPRNDDGPYTDMEVGFPDPDPPESWAEWADGEYPADVYAWVPISVIQEYIDSHGGIDIAATINRWSEVETRIRKEGEASGRFWKEDHFS